MTAAANFDRPDVETLAALIARSQIVLVEPAKCLPAGYDDVDVAILDWIVAECQRAWRSYLRM